MIETLLLLAIPAVLIAALAYQCGRNNGYANGFDEGFQTGSQKD